MTPCRLRYEQCCVVHSCLRPVREAGEYCIQHWMALSPAQRAVLQGEREHIQDTEELPAWDVLEALALLPCFDPEGEAA